MIEEELTTALARPRYGRRSAGQTGARRRPLLSRVTGTAVARAV
jgi:hypothetical protein